MTKAQANKANAQRSTGPKSAAGKSRSSRNAVSHGFQSSDVVLAHENAAEFEHILRHYQSQVDLADPEQAFLAGQIANAQWRVCRAQRLTRLFLDLEISGPSAEPSPDEIIVHNMEQRGNDVPTTLHRHEVHFQRLWWRIHRKLEALHEPESNPWDFDLEERLRQDALEFAYLKSRSEARRQAEQEKQAQQQQPEQQQHEAEPAKTITVEALIDQLSLEECREVADAVEQIENEQTNPTAEPSEAQAFVLALKPADRTKIYEAVKARIAQTNPKAIAA